MRPVAQNSSREQEGSGYLLRSLHGRYESFESEYYDLIKSAFLKYRCVRPCALVMLFSHHMFSVSRLELVTWTVLW